MPRKKVAKAEVTEAAPTVAAPVAEAPAAAPVLRNKKRPTSPKSLPTEDQVKAAESEYDLSDLGKIYAVSDAADAEKPSEAEVESESQAPQESQVQEPVKKAQHPNALLQMGRDFGLSDAEMANASTDELVGYIRGVQRQIMQTKQEPAKPAEPEVDPLDQFTDIDDNLKNYFRGLAKQAQAAEKRAEAAEKRAEAVEARENQRSAQDANGQIDAGFAALKATKLFGDGPISKFKEGDPQGTRRVLVVESLKKSPIPGLSLTEAVKQRAKELFALDDAPAAPAKPESNGHAKTGTVEDLLKQRAAWNKGTLAAPNQPVEELPKGEKRAVQWLDKQLKDRGMGQDSPVITGQSDLDGLPD